MDFSKLFVLHQRFKHAAIQQGVIYTLSSKHPDEPNVTIEVLSVCYAAIYQYLDTIGCNA